MQTAVIRTESAPNLNLGNQPHEPMHHPSPILHVSQFKPDQLPPPRAYKVLCYEEPEGVLCLEEVDIVPEPDCVEAASKETGEPGATPASTVLAGLVTSPVVLVPPLAEQEHAPGKEADSDFGDLPELDPLSPQIAPFLLSARQQRETEDKVSLRDVGRDFNDLPAEIALIKACIADPAKTLDQIVEGVNSEFFYEKRNRAIFLAVLYLGERGQAITPATVLSHLKDTEADFGSDYISYVDQVCDVRYNPDHVVVYAARLKRAVRVRGGEGYCKYEFSEPFCAYMLLQRVPNMQFLGDDLHIYNSGIWGKEDRKMFGSAAMQSIHPRHQTAKRAQSVLDYVGTIRQVGKDTFCGAYKKVGDLILINVNNGILEVSPDGTVTFREHSKDDFFSLKLAADYHPGAMCETFLSALDDALPDEADRFALQVFGGYILYPGCDYEASLVCYGPGGTGKSTILNGIGNTVGTSLCGKASLEELCKTSGYSLPTIRDKMLNLGTELNGTEIEESSNFKKLVSGEGMLARQIYCEPGELVTTCKLVFLTNNLPRFKYGTDAEARRLRLLHFNRKPEVQDPGLKAKINAEASGILVWMVQGLIRLLQEKDVPRGGDAAKHLLDTFNHGNDPVGSFVGERCVFHPDAFVTKRELYDAFKSWCQAHGLGSGENWENFFWKKLRQRHDLRDVKIAITKGSKRDNCLCGIALNPDPDLD